MFITEFASTEKLLARGMAHLVGVKEPLSQALFPGIRVSVAKDTIIRIRTAKGLPENERIANAFAQLTAITTLRNDIVHYGVQFYNDWEPRVSNSIAKMPGQERVTIATPELLRQATFDLNTIKQTIFTEIFENVEEYEGRENTIEPWQYKPEPQVRVRPPSVGKNRKRKSPPQS